MVAVAAAGLLSVACGGDSPTDDAAPPPVPDATQDNGTQDNGTQDNGTQDNGTQDNGNDEVLPGEAEVNVSGTLAPPETAGNAFTYNPELAPEGAELSVETDRENGSTTVEFEVEGLLPNRGYAAHAHVNACGPTGDAAGPHYQDSVDPAAAPDNPSADPQYANPQNEIWLDVRTDEEGDGEKKVTVPFAFTDRAPGSVVLHEAESTATAAGEAGQAGGRIACLTVPFGGE